MHRPDDAQIVEGGRKPLDSAADRGQSLRDVLAAMSRQQNKAAGGERFAAQGGITENIAGTNGGAQRVETGVAGNKNVLRNAFGTQIFRISRRGRKVDRGQIRREAAVHLLGEGGVTAIGAQSGLYMAHGDLCIKSGQSRGTGGGGVAVHQNDVRR